MCVCVYDMCVCVYTHTTHKQHSLTWANENEEYVHTVCSQEDARQLVEEFFPELLDVYDGLQQQVCAFFCHV